MLWRPDTLTLEYVGHSHVCPRGLPTWLHSFARSVCGSDDSPTVQLPRVLPGIPTVLGGPLQTLSEDGETRSQGQDVARTEVGRESRGGMARGHRHERGAWGAAAGSHRCEQNCGDNPAQAAPPETPSPAQTEVDVTPCCRAGREGGTCGQDARMGSREGFLEEGL